MLKRKNRTTNLNHTRQEIGRQLNELMNQNNLRLNELAAITSWSALYLQTVTEGRTTPNIGQLNYIASIFDRKLKIEFVE